MYPPDWPKCPHCDDPALDGKATCGRVACVRAAKAADRAAVAHLAAAVAFAQEKYPLPRCPHGKALRDHAGELLEPTCGCRAPS